MAGRSRFETSRDNDALSRYLHRQPRPRSAREIQSDLRWGKNRLARSLRTLLEGGVIWREAALEDFRYYVPRSITLGEFYRVGLWREQGVAPEPFMPKLCSYAALSGNFLEHWVDDLPAHLRDAAAAEVPCDEADPQRRQWVLEEACHFLRLRAKGMAGIRGGSHGFAEYLAGGCSAILSDEDWLSRYRPFEWQQHCPWPWAWKSAAEVDAEMESD